MMHQKLLDTLKETSYNNVHVCAVINIGCVVYDFFIVYDKKEPLALKHRETLIPLVDDLNKAISECKVVSNLLSTDNDFAYNVPTPSHKEATLDKLNKRLKLLYTLLSRINILLQPKDLFEEEAAQNLTHTIIKTDQTYLKSQRKMNTSRSLLVRSNVRSSTRNFPLSKLTKHLRAKNSSQLNFSVELDRLFNISGEKRESGTINNKLLDRVRDSSILYKFSPIKNRSSMRKMVLNKHLTTFDKVLKEKTVDGTVERQSLMDENESLQLTDFLNQMSDTTNFLTTAKETRFDQTQTVPNDRKNILRININQNDTDIDNNTYHIPVNCSEYEVTSNETVSSNVTQPSNVTTLERINDLELVETKLNSLKSQYETSL